MDMFTRKLIGGLLMYITGVVVTSFGITGIVCGIIFVMTMLAFLAITHSKGDLDG